jgi:hypothetical protein
MIVVPPASTICTWSGAGPSSLESLIQMILPFSVSTLTPRLRLGDLPSASAASL